MDRLAILKAGQSSKGAQRPRTVYFNLCNTKHCLVQEAEQNPLVTMGPGDTYLRQTTCIDDTTLV